MGNILFGHRCFLFPLARKLVKNPERMYGEEENNWSEYNWEETKAYLNCWNITVFIQFSFFPMKACAINFWLYLHRSSDGWWEIVKITMGSKCPVCCINYAPRACLITWNTTLANTARPDLLIIKMQSNLLCVGCSDWTWRVPTVGPPLEVHHKHTTQLSFILLELAAWIHAYLTFSCHTIYIYSQSAIRRP